MSLLQCTSQSFKVIPSLFPKLWPGKGPRDLSCWQKLVSTLLWKLTWWVTFFQASGSKLQDLEQRVFWSVAYTESTNTLTRTRIGLCSRWNKIGDGAVSCHKLRPPGLLPLAISSATSISTTRAGTLLITCTSKWSLTLKIHYSQEVSHSSLQMSRDCGLAKSTL